MGQIGSEFLFLQKNMAGSYLQDVAKTLEAGPSMLGAKWLLNQRGKGNTTSSIVVFLELVRSVGLKRGDIW